MTETNNELACFRASVVSGMILVTHPGSPMPSCKSRFYFLFSGLQAENASRVGQNSVAGWARRDARPV